VSSEEEKNKALACRFLEAMARADWDAMDDMMAPDFVDRSLLPGQEPDREGFKRSLAENVAPFSDMDFTIDEQVAEGDKVVTWGTASMTHDRGPVMGVPPTGKRATHTEVTLHRIVGDQIVEEWSLSDYLSIMLPALEQEVRGRERIEQDLRVARSIQQASLPKEVPEPRAGRLPPTTSLPGRWEETSTTSTSFLRVGWEWLWGTRLAKASPQHWSCPPPAACCSSPLNPRSPLRPGRY
jgi:predicted ester cyclase